MNNSSLVLRTTARPGGHQSSVDVTSNFTYLQFILSFYVTTIICVLGIILNCINVVIFMKKQFSATTYVYMATLAVADGITLLTNIPLGITRCSPYLKQCDNQQFREIRYKIAEFIPINHFIGNICETVSVWITIVVAVERYVTMRYTMVAKVHCTRRSGHLQVIITTVLAVITNLPLYFALKVNRQTNTDNKIAKVKINLSDFGRNASYIYYTWTRFILVTVIPLILLCVINSLLLHLMWQKLHKSNRKRTGLHLTTKEDSGLSVNSSRGTMQQTLIKATNLTMKSMERRQKAHNKLTILLIAVILLFLTGQIPQAIAFEKIFLVLFPNCPRWLQQDYGCISRVYSLFTYSITFFLYLGLNRHFRDALLCRLNMK